MALPWILAAISERDHPPIGTFVDVAGGRVHLRDHGAPPADADAPVLVLLHGASTSLLDLESALVPALTDTFRVVSIDRPGHGYSERGARWPDPYAQAAVARDALEAIWVGHSWAGSVVLAALLEQGDHARAGVLLAGVTHPWEDASAWHAELAAGPVLGRVFAWQYAESIGRLVLDPAIASLFAPEPVPNGYAERSGVTLSLRPVAYRANAVDLTRLSAHLELQSTRYASIHQPVLSITGTRDEVVPARDHDERLATTLPSLASVALEGAGHALHHTRTARVAELVKAFTRMLPIDDARR